MNLKIEIGKAFNLRAGEYEGVAKVQQEVGRRLFERLHYLKIQPQYILDLGCGPGLFLSQFKKKYPRAEIVGFDLAHAMLLRAKNKQSMRQRGGLVNGDMAALPFPSGLFDLVFTNQVIHWSPVLSGVVSEINRVMNVHGCLMFSTVGPDTFQELKNAWAQVDHFAHVNQFTDLHDLGDLLLATNFVDPVVDMEMLVAHYTTLPQLLTALKTQGVRNINLGRNRGLTGKKAWAKFEQTMALLRTEQGKYPLTYEVVYGHAWKGQQYSGDSYTETRIPVATLREKR